MSTVNIQKPHQNLPQPSFYWNFIAEDKSESSLAVACMICVTNIKVTVLLGDAGAMVGSALMLALVYLWPWPDGLPHNPTWLQQQRQDGQKTRFTFLLSVLFFFVDVLFVDGAKVKDNTCLTVLGRCERWLVPVGKRHQTSLQQASDTAVVSGRCEHIALHHRLRDTAAIISILVLYLQAAPVRIRSWTAVKLKLLHKDLF